jgi:hypothetical protein
MSNKILTPEELNELIELAEDGYKLHVSNGSHNEFLREDKDILRKAKEYLKQMTEQPEEKILLPKKLTAENGMKTLLIGEFRESIKVKNEEYCGCNDCNFCFDFPDTPEYITRVVDVEWDTIKKIYNKIVEHFINL